MGTDVCALCECAQGRVGDDSNGSRHRERGGALPGPQVLGLQPRHQRQTQPLRELVNAHAQPDRK